MLTVSRSLGRHAAGTLPCSTSPTGDEHAAPALTWAARDDRPYRAPAAAAVGARSARLGNLLGGTRPAGDDVGDDVPGGAGAQTHEHLRVTPPAAARPNGSGTPVAVRIIPGETGAVMCQPLCTYLRISTGYPDHTVTVLCPAPRCKSLSELVGRACYRLPHACPPHRTVDRVIEIRETVSLRPRGVSLAELAAALDAARKARFRS